MENGVPQGVNDVWSFGVEGSPKVWEVFVQEYPPAHNNEIIASNYRTVVKGEDVDLPEKMILADVGVDLRGTMSND